eukprot:Skav225409  [mRNA]  locus=scaffold2656:578704:584952:+ [translate_table: standard]
MFCLDLEVDCHALRQAVTFGAAAAAVPQMAQAVDVDVGSSLNISAPLEALPIGIVLGSNTSSPADPPRLTTTAFFSICGLRPMGDSSSKVGMYDQEEMNTPSTRYSKESLSCSPWSDDSDVTPMWRPCTETDTVLVDDE